MNTMTLEAALKANIVELVSEEDNDFDELDTWYEPVDGVQVTHPGKYDIMHDVEAICYTCDPEGDYVTIVLSCIDDEVCIDPKQVHLMGFTV